MSNRGFRFVIALLALAAAAAAGYRIYYQEQQLAREDAAARVVRQTAEMSLVSVSELRAALYAYVGAGQGLGFWSVRSGMLIDSLRASLLELDAQAATVAPLTDALDLTDRLAAAEQRARDHVRASEPSLAAEVVYTESRDLYDGLRLQIARSRDRVLQATAARQAAMRTEQGRLALAAATILSLAILLLIVPGRQDGPPAAPADTSEDTIGYGPGVRIAPLSAQSGSSVTTTAPAAPDAPDAPTEPVAPAAPVLNATATLCTDLARLADANELTRLLERASEVLDASGIIIWLASADRSQLLPAASSGFAPRLLRQLTAIPPDAANLTAAAYREQAPRAARAQATAMAALAMPLIGPDGPVGVLSMELKDVAEVSQTQVALAAIIAAQLATLLGTMTAAEATAAKNAASG